MRISPSHVSQTVSGLDILPHAETGSTYSGFVQDEVSIVKDRLSLTVGSKLEHNNYTGAEAQPSVRFLWQPGTRQSIWAAAAKAVRTPSRLEEGIRLIRYLPGATPTFLQLIGNTSFKSEELRGYELGFRRAVGDQLFVDVALFRNRHDHLQSLGEGTVQVETGPPVRVFFVVPYANTIHGTSNGLEIAPDWKPSRWWQVKASYSYLDIDLENSMTAKDIFNLAALYEGSSPRHRLMVRPLVTLPIGWEIDGAYRHVSALAGRGVGSYGTLDLRVGWHVRPTLEVSVAGQNLLQGHHLEFGHDPGPAVAVRRSMYASVSWRR